MRLTLSTKLFGRRRVSVKEECYDLKRKRLGRKNILQVALKILDIFRGKNLYVSINESKTKEVIRGDKNRQLIVL